MEWNKGFAVVLATLLVASTAAEVPAQAEEWKAYIADPKKGDKEFPEDTRKLKDEQWLNIAFTEFAGFKPRVGVVVSEERKAGPQEYNNEWIKFFASREGKPDGAQGLNNLETQVRQAMGKTHRFTMVERTTALDDVVGEQDFGASGRVEKKTAAKIGKISGADYTVKVEMVEANPEKESKSIKAVGGGIGQATAGLGSLGLSGTVAWVRLNVRIIRTETAQLVADLTVDGTSKAKGLGLGGGLIKAASGGIVGGGMAFDSKKAASLSDAAQAAANKAAYLIATTLQDVPWEGSVIKVDGQRVMINAGSNVGLKAGLELTLFSKGEEMKDPDSGESLGFDKSEIGKLRIASVTEKFSTCELTSGGQGAKTGDIVQFVPGRK